MVTEDFLGTHSKKGGNMAKHYKAEKNDSQEDTWSAYDLEGKKLVFTSEKDLYRVYQDHLQFHVYQWNEGLVTAFEDLEDAKDEAKDRAKAQINSNPDSLPNEK